jgi:hypothetical protein
MPPRRAAILIAPLLLGACVGTPEQGAEAVLAGVLAQQRAALAASGTSAPPSAAPGGAVAALIGATPERIQARFGRPDLRRAEAGAEVWRYSAAHCHLDLVFYREAAGLQVAHAAARAAGIVARSESECLSDIAVRPAARLAGVR